jgi:NAD-dependent deacetylase
VTRRYDPEKVFDIRWFYRDPGFFYEFARDFIDLLASVRPTFAHHFLARLEVTGKLRGVITQNIDMLHQSAGSSEVVELHGSYGSASCSGCGRTFNGLNHGWWDRLMRSGPRPPVAPCPECGEVLKPDIVFFGEMVKGYAEAEEMISNSDLLLVLGSSLRVTPASLLPRGAAGTTVIVNQGPVSLESGRNRYFIESGVDDYLAEVARDLGEEFP